MKLLWWRRQAVSPQWREQEALRIAKLCSATGLMLIAYARSRLLKLDAPLQAAEVLHDLQGAAAEFVSNMIRGGNDASKLGYVCSACEDAYGHGYMLKDDVWDRITEDTEEDRALDLLCLPCADQRMLAVDGRHLEPRDFSDVPINEPLMWMATRISQAVLGVDPDAEQG